MTQWLTPHFALEEFQKGDPIPPECVPMFTMLCEQILEPLRHYFSEALVIITSGYRSPEENAAAHGQPNSEHVATATKCAADFYIEGWTSREVFDWMRNNPSLPFHQLIYETDARGGAIVHVSINIELPAGTRSVLTGATHNLEPYQKADYVAYVPPAGTGEEA
jgi:hypothetical protein